LTLASINEAAEGTLAKAEGNDNPQRDHYHSANAAKHHVNIAPFPVEHGRVMTYNVDVKRTFEKTPCGF
jgi:hypothetical protein